MRPNSSALVPTPTQVSGSLWRTIIDTIHSLAKLHKAEQLRRLAQQHATSLEDAAAAAAGAGAAAGKEAAAASLAAALSGGGGGSRLHALLPYLEHLKVQVAHVRQWHSFSGRWAGRGGQVRTDSGDRTGSVYWWACDGPVGPQTRGHSPPTEDGPRHQAVRVCRL